MDFIRKIGTYNELKAKVNNPGKDGKVKKPYNPGAYPVAPPIREL